MTDLNGAPADETVDLAAIAADDALLDALAAAAPPLSAPQDATTWDGVIDEKPTDIRDAVIWSDDPRPPTSTPVKKTRAVAGEDAAARLLSVVLAEVEFDIAAASERVCAAVLAELDRAPQPGSGWARVARRTGTRGVAVAAAFVVSLGGVAAASVGAGPGNVFYPVHKLFAGANPGAEQAYAVARVTAALDEAQGALDAHRNGLAHGKITVARERLKAVQAGVTKDALQSRYDALAAAIAAAVAADDTPSTTPSTDTSTSATSDPTDAVTTPPTSSETHHPTPGEHATPGQDGKSNGKDHSATAHDSRTAGGQGDGRTTDAASRTKTSGDHSGDGSNSGDVNNGASTSPPVPTATPHHRRHRTHTVTTDATTHEGGDKMQVGTMGGSDISTPKP